jgi:hypothetical protein
MSSSSKLVFGIISNYLDLRFVKDTDKCVYVGDLVIAATTLALYSS